MPIRSSKMKDTEIEKRLTSLEVLIQDTRDDIKSIKDNHLMKIYGKLDDYQKTISEIEKKILKEINSRPSWLVSVVITLLCSLVTGLVVYSIFPHF